jgi:hypothetical protein
LFDNEKRHGVDVVLNGNWSEQILAAPLVMALVVSDTFASLMLQNFI